MGESKDAKFPLVENTGHELLFDDIDRADGCYLYDGAGKRYVDLESGVWCTSVGHGNRRILRALEAQYRRIGHTGFCYLHPASADAAREFLDLVGFEGGKAVFLCSGSEAVEFSVRLARLAVDRPRMIALHDGYFGAYGSAHRRSREEWFTFDWSECADCPDETPCDGTCRRLAEVPFPEIGGFLFEPGSSSGYVRFPPRKLIESLVARVRAEGGLVLANEVTTGVGRTGEWFGYTHYGISPDTVAMGKGVGNGYPVSVVAIAPGVIERLGGAPVPYLQSHQNDPLGAAVAREVIRFIRDEGLIERSRELGEKLRAGLEEVRRRCDRVIAVRGRGLMAAIDLRDDDDASFTRDAHRELVRRGFIVGKRPGINVLRVDPPLVIAEEDLDGFLAALEEAVSERPAGR